MTINKTLANARFARERPKQREIILREKLIPDVVISRGKYFWDGWSARKPDGRTVILTDEWCAQMLVMAKAGTWGDLSCVVLDWNHYAIAREFLNQKTPHSVSDVKEWHPNPIHDPKSAKERGASA